MLFYSNIYQFKCPTDIFIHLTQTKRPDEWIQRCPHRFPFVHIIIEWIPNLSFATLQCQERERERERESHVYVTKKANIDIVISTKLV